MHLLVRSVGNVGEKHAFACEKCVGRRESVVPRLPQRTETAQPQWHAFPRKLARQQSCKEQGINGTNQPAAPRGKGVPLKLSPLRLSS